MKEREVVGIKLIGAGASDRPIEERKRQDPLFVLDVSAQIS